MNIFYNEKINASNNDLLKNESTNRGITEIRELFNTIKSSMNTGTGVTYPISQRNNSKRSLAHSLLRYLYASHNMLSSSTAIAGGHTLAPPGINTTLGVYHDIQSPPGAMFPDPDYPAYSTVMPVSMRAAPAVADSGAISSNRGNRRPANDKPDNTRSRAIQNENVAYYLHTTALMRAEDETQIELMINRVIDCLPKPGTFLPELTRALLTHSGAYGAQQGENLSVDYQLGQVKAWIAGNMLNGTVDTFMAQMIIKAGSGPNGARPRQDIVIHRLESAIDHHLSSFINLTAASVNYIFNDIILPVMPAKTIYVRVDPRSGAAERQGCGILSPAMMILC